MTPEEVWGGAFDLVTPNDAVLSWNRSFRMLTVTMTTGTRTLTLPPASSGDMPFGINILYLANVGGTAFDVVGDFRGTRLLSAGFCLAVSKISNSAGVPTLMTGQFAIL